ncbi:flagellar basal-body rod modification protein FlgD [Modestobacter sp. DSM 44400]|uniref:flagellar hook assembly protein FlgD n=1 Tax=Modestobacter sp. DSM 44400 TaxID=1550230 RepID=UPI00089BAAA7|nr:flagellar hook capping FlgD N-terminal domain-containing protein [Modestobacter sp. DSM 44400]SDX87667.1 flagellar basal-body rod modification protein FlgD [Modestobacter sp. DSM 44400]
MSSPIAGSTGPQATSNAATMVDRSDQMDKDTFLKLLVAQMKYQDPSNPASSSELMAQTATFSQVEQLQQIATQNAAMLAMQRATSAGTLVGQSVSYTAEDGTTATGKVSSVVIATDTSEAKAMVGGVAVPLGRITEVFAGS